MLGARRRTRYRARPVQQEVQNGARSLCARVAECHSDAALERNRNADIHCERRAVHFARRRGILRSNSDQLKRAFCSQAAPPKRNGARRTKGVLPCWFFILNACNGMQRSSRSHHCLMHPTAHDAHVHQYRGAMRCDAQTDAEGNFASTIGMTPSERLRQDDRSR